jgi:hypothetical protein
MKDSFVTIQQGNLTVVSHKRPSYARTLVPEITMSWPVYDEYIASGCKPYLTASYNEFTPVLIAERQHQVLDIMIRNACLIGR